MIVIIIGFASCPVSSVGTMHAAAICRRCTSLVVKDDMIRRKPGFLQLYPANPQGAQGRNKNKFRMGVDLDLVINTGR